jgi:ssDNA-binding Zn-finger/Zn-ribbon topoisomerase 1
MIWIIVAVVIFAIALFLLAKRSQKGSPAQEVYPYQKSDALFTPAERSFLGVLQQAVGYNAAIFGKVRVADVVEPKTGLSRSARQKAFNKISAKHFDFLLCDKEDLSVACAIELDDGSHNSKRRHERDEFLKGVCEAAGVPLIQVPAKSGYVIEEVRDLLPAYLTGIDSTDLDKTVPTAIQKPKTNEKVCPACSASMVKRVAKNGKHAGKSFWACKAYPKCKTIEAIGA